MAGDSEDLDKLFESVADGESIDWDALERQAPDEEARALIRTNVEAMGLTGVTRIFRRDATDLGPAGNMDPYRLALIDPPYDQGLGEKALAILKNGRWLEAGAIAVLEERASAVFTLPEGYTAIDRRTWGDTQAVFARLEG